MADDWELCTVLKSFSTALATNIDYNITEEDRRPIPPAFPSFISQQNDLVPNNIASFEAYNPLVPFSQSINPNIINPNITPTPCSSANVSNIPPQPPPKKPRPYYYQRKKSLPSKVVEVAAEDLLAVDPWCWRKYGQKPIKGSPHPRSYYKCSSDTTKCPARKHVERSQTDPSVFVVSYDGEHTHPLPTHRNPLSGSTRINKWESGTDTDTSSSPSIIPTSAPTSSATTLAPWPESGKKVCEDDQEVVMISNLAVGPTEDIYMGIRELGGGGF